ncbi:MAG: four helix bundle protein [Ignavibacteria bacterium]|nr:four helix bundle protein [Ignavibacteria bacterium]
MESNKYKTDLKDRCFKFSINTIKICDSLPNKRSSWIISDQLIRSATSIGANIMEAKSSSSKLEFKKFYEIALKSANETIYWLNLLKELNLTDLKNIDELIKESQEIANMLGKSVITLKKNYSISKTQEIVRNKNMN